VLILRKEAALLRTSDVSFESGACEVYITTYNMVINSTLALGSRKTTRNLDGVGRSKDHLDANGLLVSGPAFKHTNPNLSPYLCSCSVWEVYRDCCIYIP
jgi:hypothetical protein